jgi:hypothetical protein
MRVTTLITVLFSMSLRANPVGHVAPPNRVYLASEHLTVTISPADAELKGTFTFQYRQDGYSPTNRLAKLEFPVWFPERDTKDPTVAAFWKVFSRDQGYGEVGDQTRPVFDKALALRVFEGDEQGGRLFSILTSRSPRHVWVPQEWHREAGYCCLVFTFHVLPAKSGLTVAPLTVSYRQPHIQTSRGAKFFYLPVFQNLPKGLSTADTNRYSITLVAQPGCSMRVSNGHQEATVEAGQSITLSPRHHQPIRAMVTSKPNFTRDCVETPRRERTSRTFGL